MRNSTIISVILCSCLRLCETRICQLKVAEKIVAQEHIFSKDFWLFFLLSLEECLQVAVYDDDFGSDSRWGVVALTRWAVLFQ